MSLATQASLVLLREQNKVEEGPSNCKGRLAVASLCLPLSLRQGGIGVTEGAGVNAVVSHFESPPT